VNEPSARLAQGDVAAFAALYDAHADHLHHYLTVRLGSRTEADDALQDVFVRLVAARRRLRSLTNLKAYLFTMARNEANRRGAQRSRDARHRSPLQADELFLAAPDDTEAYEMAEMVAAALGVLGDEQREVVELKVYAGLTFREIADVIGVPLQTAASRYAAALGRLKEWLVWQGS
jgi:RNA polymerase sigma factor (sigma-70 family)